MYYYKLYFPGWVYKLIKSKEPISPTKIRDDCFIVRISVISYWLYKIF